MFPERERERDKRGSSRWLNVYIARDFRIVFTFINGPRVSLFAEIFRFLSSIYYISESRNTGGYIWKLFPR